jgi:hypothetical protein
VREVLWRDAQRLDDIGERAIGMAVEQNATIFGDAD